MSDLRMISIRLPRGLWLRFRAVTYERGLSLTGAIKLAVERWLAENDAIPRG